MVGVVELALWISSDRHTELKLVCQWIDKIRLLGFTTLHDTRRYAIPQCWAPHTQTQRHGVLAMMNYLILSYLSVGSLSGGPRL
jgi:hypothetical protein